MDLHKRTGKGWLFGLVTATCITVCGSAGATGFDLATGPSLTSSGRMSAAVAASAFGTPPADARAHFEPIATVAWVKARHTRVEELDHDVMLVAGGVRFTSASRHWFLSEQLAVTSQRTGALSSRFEFMTSGGWQQGHFIMMLRHISNAHVLGSGKNLGETMLLAGVRW